MKSTAQSLEEYLRRPKKATLAGLKRFGIHTVRDLLYHFPSRYAGAAEIFVGVLEPNKHFTIIGTVQTMRMRKTRGTRRVMIAEATVIAEGAKIPVIWFNQPYIARQFAAGDTVTVSGKTAGTKKIYLTNPIIKHTQHAEEGAETRKELIAVYPETGGISSTWLSETVGQLLAEDTVKRMPDPLPENMRKGLKLPGIYDALVYIHKPRNDDDHQAAKKRFIFEKTLIMFTIQQMRKHEHMESKAYAMHIDTGQADAFMADRLSFRPTGDQKKAVQDILNDIQKDKPMARLLEGDVGSGKTVVAAAVMHSAVTARPEERTSGRPQIAYLAPTDVLAKQQFHAIMDLFSHLPITIGYISGKTCLKYPSKINPNGATAVSKAQLKKWIASGEVVVLFGTHAMIQKDIQFQRLALAVIDEQHRFGVAQRQSLISLAETHRPHLLSMTATPIPRTLALTIYGDLDISVLEDMPKERKTVRTKLVSSAKKQEVYDHIREEIAKGHQAYILCPRIEESDDSPLRSVEEEYAHLVNTVFPDMTIVMLHGKMKPKEKQEIMERFTDGTVHILVCTTVIEVGINVPNATIVAILHAERFGLAQLHQIRGRVIRSSHQPYCYAITDSTGENTLERLNIFETEHNGFILAQKDLDMRGSGEIAGLRQSGIPDLVVEGLRNQKLVALAQQEAKNIIDRDPELKRHRELRICIQQDTTHRE